MEVRTEWQPSHDVHIMWSVLTGIEQARNNEGTFLNDQDLATDDDP
jgi:hypothetical protein